ncbi:hypothetical protein SVAN01_08434 [Stagonosporopsis vannaccii]|nr:hypothetical protein SVAN01_08434 [Stagonosporopsis vannaccii]
MSQCSIMAADQMEACSLPVQASTEFLNPIARCQPLPVRRAHQSCLGRVTTERKRTVTATVRIARAGRRHVNPDDASQESRAAPATCARSDHLVMCSVQVGGATRRLEQISRARCTRLPRVHRAGRDCLVPHQAVAAAPH